MKNLIYSSFFLLIPFTSFAQEVQANDYFGNIGKIYVVAAVMLLLFGTIIAFLVYLERKLSRLEKLMEDD
jgi:Na+/alanine symporter